MGAHRSRCEAKSDYPTRRLAEKVLAKRAREDPGSTAGVKVYRCPFCSCFHLGHTPSLASLETMAAEIRRLT